MKLLNGGGGGGGDEEVRGGGGEGRGGGEKNVFSFKKCSAFQFVKRKVRKWKMLNRHHGDAKQKEAESEVHLGGGPWGVRTNHQLASPVLLECCVCSGPFVSYALEEAWQPRQRTQAMDLYYHSEPEYYCCRNDSTFMKQRRLGLNDFIQRLATSNSDTCKHPEVQSIVNLAPQQQEAELMNSNPTPPPSPSQQMNLGPSSNPTAKPSDFHFLKVIGKGSFGKVLLARHRTDDQFYAVKVLQKKAILKKKEEKHIMSERNVLLKNIKHPFLVGLHYSFQTADKLYFVLDYINGGEVRTGPNDLRHFDPEFTDEPVPSSIGCSPDSSLITASITEAADAFLGFSYAPSMGSYLSVLSPTPYPLIATPPSSPQIRPLPYSLIATPPSLLPLDLSSPLIATPPSSPQIRPLPYPLIVTPPSSSQIRPLPYPLIIRPLPYPLIATPPSSPQIRPLPYSLIATPPSSP
ncbi:serine/threonine-protein kinase Sgk1 [Oncorhynchus kisutch]|uniref:serine/threonine-protein kinase Sgk1 n=1 Tax=Oncorhynchus kisutch TaxID=8019 RepID=UPI0012DCFA2F|nr:serine/threonine-protein kinase Sgk1 [Oncorhynchus kisutch]